MDSLSLIKMLMARSDIKYFQLRASSEARRWDGHNNNDLILEGSRSRKHYTRTVLRRNEQNRLNNVTLDNMDQCRKKIPTYAIIFGKFTNLMKHLKVCHCTAASHHELQTN